MVPGTAVVLFCILNTLAATRHIVSTRDWAVMARLPKPMTCPWRVKTELRRRASPSSSTVSRPPVMARYLLRNVLFRFKVSGLKGERTPFPAEEVRRKRSLASRSVSGRFEIPEAATRSRFAWTMTLGLLLPLFSLTSHFEAGLAGIARGRTTKGE